MRFIVISVIVFFYNSIANSFESELVPIELSNILATKNDDLLLHKDPLEDAPIINKFQITKGSKITFDKSLTRTLKTRKVIIKADEVYLQGKGFGNVSYLSRKTYRAAFEKPRSEWEGLEGYHFKKGDSFEELHHAPEGSCMIKWHNEVIWIEACLWYGKSNDYNKIGKPEFEWWIRVTQNDKPQGWLLMKHLSSLELQ